MANTVLMERTDAGITVELILTADGRELWLDVRTENEAQTAEIAPEKALDAFAHPMLYLHDPSCFA